MRGWKSPSLSPPALRGAGQHPPPRCVPCSCGPGPPAWPSAAPPSPGWPHRLLVAAGTPGQGHGGDKGCADPTWLQCSPSTHLLHPGELEALLGRQGEGGVVLQEEEEVLLPAHLQQRVAWGRGAPLCPPVPPSSGDGAVTRADASTTPWNQSWVAQQVSTSVRLAADKCSRSRS